VPQQVDDAHRRARAPRAERADEPALVDAEIAPLRDIAMHRIVERDAAFLDQHHQRDAGERLGHGVDAEDRVFLQRAVALDVHAPERAAMGDLAVALDEGQRAGQFASVQVFLLEEPVDALQARSGQTGGLGSGHGRVSCQMREVLCGSRMKMYTRSEPSTHTVTYQ
jgi:hypothetical protein